MSWSQQSFRRLVLAGAVCVLSVCLAAGARAASSFPLGQSARNGAMCTAQADDEDPAAQFPFAKSWGIECYGWEGTTLGHIYYFPSKFLDRPVADITPPVWRRALDERATCGSFAPADVPGLTDAQRASCIANPGGTKYSVYLAKSDDGVVIAEGFVPIEELVQTGLKVAAGVISPPSTTEQQRIAVAPDSSEGVESLAAAANSARLAPGWLRAHAHLENQGWRFGDAERDFRALTTDATLSPHDRAAAQLNWALNVSNEGRFDEADAHFQAVKDAVAAARDPELDLLLLNYSALHELNQRHFPEALKIAQQALALQAQMPQNTGEASAGIVVTDGSLDIDTNLAYRLNQTSHPTGFRTAALSAAQRMQILRAQANYIAGCAQMGAGDNQAARQSLDQANDLLNVRGLGRTAVWLQALVTLQLAELDLAENHPGRAESNLSAMITTFQTQEHLAASPAEARLYLELGRAEAANGNGDQAIRDYATGMELFRQTRGTLGNSANEAAPYFDLLVAKAKSDPENAARYQSQFFDAAQSVVSLSTARTVARLAARVGQGDSVSATAARAYDDAQRQLTIKAAQIQRAQASGEYSDAQKSADDAALKRLTEQVQALHQQLLAANPRYGQLVASTATLDALQHALKPGEIYVKNVLLGSGGYAIAVTPEKVTIYSFPLSRDQAQAAVTKLRHPFDTENYLPRFSADAAWSLFNTVFGPVANDVASAKSLIYEPDGPLISLPASVFVVDADSAKLYKSREAEFLKGKDVDLYQGLAWLGRNTDVSLSVSATAFLQSRELAPSHAQKAFVGFGGPVIGDPGDPRLFSLLTKDQHDATTSCSRVRALMANYMHNAPIPGAVQAIRQIGGSLGAGPDDEVFGAAFTDTGVMARHNLADYRIIFFGTHGLLPDNAACLPEPALVTSLDGGDSDALLDASEILELKLDADLVVLSACSTAGVGSSNADRTGMSGSGEALGGLARDFIYAGSRGLVVSQWSVDADASLVLMKHLFVGGAANQGDALRRAEVALMDSKDFSHPFYWAGFSLVGDGARPMPAK